ncbi:MAG TPA: N-6 DNA methylase [Syntrophomonas sp.]|nr:N-6 DNA methylase [Syntrophomonas sp.]
MQLSWIEIQSRALQFSKKWKDAKDEASEAQSFLNEFFEIFGVDRKRIATFEKKVPMGSNRNGYIDLLWKGVILVEMKSFGKSLDKAYAQAKDYAFHLEDEELPEYIMVSDFHNIRLYRLTTGQVWNFKTSQLHKHVKLFADLAGYKAAIDRPTDKEVDIKAAETMAKLHDLLKAHGYEGHQLEVYLVRLLFCMFADDTGIFEKNIFFDYISDSKEDGSDLSARIARLFEILDTPPQIRAKQTMLSDELKRFTYINGKLFNERLSFADYDYKMRKMLLECCSLNWGYISPAIFGAMFQGVMNPQERRELGAHYTSEENILKVIKPLFLDELWEEFEFIKGNSKQLQKFHEKLSKLKFLDPACGCGNFLIITYRELRCLELEILKMLIDNSGQLIMDISPYCIVNVNQFYGIEIEEFPCQIAQTGMWLIDHQMNTLVAEHFGLYYARLPLQQSATIINGNALTIDWESIVPKNELNYILGNPPFGGARIMDQTQKRELLTVFNDIKGAGNLDYVTAWYSKASAYIQNTKIKVAFVSTNSISQGEQATILWKTLFEIYKVEINFAYRTFKWSNEAKGKATVNCVIVGFSLSNNKTTKSIYDNDNVIKATKINQYLVDAPIVFIESRTTALCNVPKIGIGNKPVDGGNYLFTEHKKDEFIKMEPEAEKFFKVWIGSDEFINGYNRYCLWIGDCPPDVLKNMPQTLKRVEAVRQFRLASKSSQTIKLAETPRRFHVENMPQGTYIIIPKVSSEKRKYIPLGFLDENTLCSDLVFLIPNATLYHFGILTSIVHMAWMRAVAGRLEMRYRYSKDIVYNNFPWPEPSEKQKEDIEKAAKAVLEARELFPDSSLADLYNPLTMPPELVKAHNNLDRTVITAYGIKGLKTETEIVSVLMERYQQLVSRT